MAIFAANKLAAQLKFKLDNQCSNNQAEELAIVKALEAIETLDITENGSRTAVIFTDSRITIDFPKNINNHNFLIEEIRKKLSILETANWTIEFSWVKERVGRYGNKLAKEAARKRDAMISHNKIPTRILVTPENKFKKSCICDEYVINLFVCIYELEKGHKNYLVLVLKLCYHYDTLRNRLKYYTEWWFK